LPVQPILNNPSSDHLVEIFSSIQGEGPYVGFRQIFIRFHGCSLDCTYCDSVDTRETKPPENCSVEERPGKGKFLLYPNPLSCDQVVKTISEWICCCPGAHHSISITGGEPLLHVETLTKWLPVLKSYLPIYLETNGIHYDELSKCIDSVDFISMDIKLPSTSGQQDLWDKHRIFLKISSSRRVFVKAVVSDSTQIWEILNTCDLILSENRSIPLILQPKMSTSGTICISPHNLLTFQEKASLLLNDVRIIPQTHRFLGLI